MTRLYSPDQFGLLAVFAAAYAICVGLITLKYDLSIILPSDDSKATELTVLTLSISLLLSTVLLIALCIYYLFVDNSLQWYFLLLPICTIMGAAYTCMQQWSARASDYRRYARSQVINSLTNVTISILIAIATTSFFGSLVIGFVCGLASALIYLSFKFLRTYASIWHGFPVFFSTLKATAIEFKRFPTYVLPSSLLATLGVNLSPFIFQSMFTLQEVGYYAIANRFLMTPSALIGGAIAEAFRAEFVSRQKRGIETVSFFTCTLLKLILVALPIFSIFFLVVSSLFALILGEAYRESGVLARYICIGVFAQFISLPFHYVFVATGYVRLGLIIQSLATGLPIIAIIIGGLNGNMKQAVLFASVLTLISSFALICFAYRCCKLNHISTLKDIRNV